MRHLLRFSTVLVVLILIVSTAYGQTTISAGAIAGTIKDSTGASLPGVTVTVSSPRLQGTRSAVSDSGGQYVVPLLPPGVYRAEYALSGIQPQVRSGISVNAAQTTTLDVAMQMGMTEAIEVRASAVVVDPTQTQQQQTLKEEHLKFTSVGSPNRSFQVAVLQVAEATGGSNPNVAGANTAMNTFMIDGINALTDPVTHTFASNMVFDAIQEVNVIAFGKDAEYRSSGATVNVITKSGGNDFSGSLDYRYSDPDFFTATGNTYPAAPAYYGGPPVGNPTLKFDKSAITDKAKQGQATFGGPIMRDKLWFFASAHRPETSRIPPNTVGFQPGSRDFTGWNTLGKITFTPFSNHTFSARHTNSYARITNTQFSSLVPIEADSYQTQHNKNISLSYDAVVSSKWLVNAQAGRTPAALAVAPMSNDLSKVRFSDLDTSVVGGNYNNAQGRTSYRNELLASTTYYTDRFGSHAIKVGANADRNGFDSYNFTTGDPATVTGLPADACSRTTGGRTDLLCGVTYTKRGGVPVTATVTVRNPVLGADAKGTSFYAQDMWNPLAALTIRAGLRYDKVNWESSKPVPSFKLLQPRVGVAYDLFRNGGTVVHAFGGKIMDENQLTLPNNLNTRFSGSTTWTWNNTTQAYTFTRSTVSATGSAVDPNLKSPYSNEYSFGITHRLFRNTSIDITAEKRTAHNLFGTFQGVTNAAGTAVVSQLPAALFTACPNGMCNVHRSQYQGVVLKVESRPTRNADVTFSWVRSESKNSTGDNTQNLGGPFTWFPVNFTNYFGYEANDAKDRVKFNGYYRFPWDITAGASYYWDSGTPWSVTQTNAAGFGTVFLEPRGSRRFPDYHQLDMQLQKDFKVGPATIGLIGSVLNVLNKEIATGINGNAGTRAITDPTTGKLYIDPNQQTGANRLSATFGRFTSFQRPRRYEAGVRIEF